ncbi:MAG: hypothetical protein EA352_03440 [Gemmatimonadales bacterium]|nr:MAG: hypothetical protein EA352_03440 [Gemmatimonadales bacterium]
MKADARTLRDLDVLPGAASGPCLADHLDRTTTRGGRRAFIRRLSNPLGSAAEIARVQEALRFLADTPQVDEELPRAGELDPVVHYLGSRYLTLGRGRLPRRWWQAGVIRLRFPDIHEHASQGGRGVLLFLSRLGRLARELEAGPPLLAEMASGLLEALDEGPLAGLRDGKGVPGGFDGVLRLDRLLREDARELLAHLVEEVHELDALMGMARLAREEGYSFPRVEEGEAELVLEGLVHPFVADPVPNDLVLGEEERVVFLTGPNMAGKSTWLKGCGVVVLLAHCGMAVPARTARMGVYRTLVAATTTEDRIWDGVSYFLAEVRRVREIVDAVTDEGPCFILADELFRGTNVRDALEATTAVLQGLSRARGSRFLVASHLPEVALELEGEDAVVFLQVRTTVEDGVVRFDHRVGPGVSKQRLGMEVLRAEGVLDALEGVRDRTPGSN